MRGLLLGGERLLAIALVAGSVVFGGCAGASGARTSIFALDLRPDGRYLLAQDDAASLRVWDLEAPPAKQRIFATPTTPFTIQRLAVAFLGNTNQIVFECMAQGVCSAPIEDLSHEEPLFSFDPQDRAVAFQSSLDGKRLLVGTAGGRLLTYDRVSREAKTLKPRDLWSVGSGEPIYFLEGNATLSRFMSIAYMPGIPVSQERGSTLPFPPDVVENPVEGYYEYNHSPKERVREPLWATPTLWSWEGERWAIDEFQNGQGSAGGFSEDGRGLFLCPRGGGAQALLTLAGRESQPEVRQGSWLPDSCAGARFLDTEGRLVGVAAHGLKVLFVLDVSGAPQEPSVKATLPLRRAAAYRRRSMAVAPAKGWVFLGMADGGVDWYEFREKPKLALRYVRTLR